MIQETITQIEARIKEAKSLNDEKKTELLNLLSTFLSSWDFPPNLGVSARKMALLGKSREIGSLAWSLAKKIGGLAKNVVGYPLFPG